ncbi:DUF2092 domain-containing protein [Phreatobacter stygius]|uniref:DUF2092 domain-containing protein n=1 Tax=Phreatobacter stygius TaxID=1940610 RepID=A0A4D7BC02_9HYPH|nr:DUF2092 domain-containing protein [Phreatobacter stygius]QCI68255.1 DUF2092 domain-containing protein [Phreatobacter stygius]
MPNPPGRTGPLRKAGLCVLAVGALAAGAMAVAGPAEAQTRPPRGAEARLITPAVDPASIAALSRMGEYLRSLKAFEINATTLVEVVLDNDQKIGIVGTARYRARLPDRLRVDLAAGSHQREIVYDGKTLMVIAPREHYYAQVDTRPTIKEMLEEAARRLGVDMPLADLFAWGASDAQWNAVRGSFRVGEAIVGGAPCEHWAFRERDQDWELCIRTGDQPLPLRIAIVRTRDPARPRFEAILTWTVNPDLGDGLFAYAPGAGTTRIEFLTSDMTGAR